MKLVTFSVLTPVGAVCRIGALHGYVVVDLCAAFGWHLCERGVHAADTLASEIIPTDMVQFLSRWPVAREAAETAFSFVRDRARQALSPSGAKIFYEPGECRLLAPLRPRRIKDYLVYEEHKKQAMKQKGLELPDLWYRMPTYTNRNHLGLAGPGDDIAWPRYTEKLDFEFELALVMARGGRDIKARDAMEFVAGITIYNDLSARDVQADEGRIGAGPERARTSTRVTFSVPAL